MNVLRGTIDGTRAGGAGTVLARGELNRTVFLGRSPGSVDTPKQPVAVTAEQRQTLEAIKYRLRDPGFTRFLTATKLLAMREVISLPPPLRQELTIEVMGMLARGELDQTQFLAVPVTPGAEPLKH
ncbi:MAG TPA: hypothetical protein VGA00_12515 [Acidiferrobacterales bacterium]|jgi:hypothetical protein